MEETIKWTEDQKLGTDFWDGPTNTPVEKCCYYWRKWKSLHSFQCDSTQNPEKKEFSLQLCLLLLSPLKFVLKIKPQLNYTLLFTWGVIDDSSAIPMAPWALRGAVLCPPPPYLQGCVRVSEQNCSDALQLWCCSRNTIFKPSWIQRLYLLTKWRSARMLQT